LDKDPGESITTDGLKELMLDAYRALGGYIGEKNHRTHRKAGLNEEEIVEAGIQRA
jgi:hypothetical protein